MYGFDRDRAQVVSIDPEDGAVDVVAGTDEYRGGESTVIGDAAEADLQNITTIELGPRDDVLYFADHDYVYALDLAAKTIAMRFPVDNAADLAVDRSGRVYAASLDGICRAARGADTCTALIGDEQPGHQTMIDPNALAVGPHGTIYFADSGRVRLLNPKTKQARTIAGTWSTRQSTVTDGVAVSAGRLFVPDMAVADDGTVYLIDQNHRVRAVDPKTDRLDTVAGTGHYVSPSRTSDRAGGGGYGGDGGPADEAKLDNPESVALGPDGAVYIADTGNERIRVVGDVELPGTPLFTPVRVVVGVAVLLVLLLAGLFVLRRRRRNRRPAAASGPASAVAPASSSDPTDTTADPADPARSNDPTDTTADPARSNEPADTGAAPADAVDPASSRGPADTAGPADGDREERS